MKPEYIETLYAATFRKAKRSYCADFWESAELSRVQERSAARAFMERPDFAWAIARRLAAAGKMPALLKKPAFRWLRKAVVLIIAPHKLADDPDLKAIADARSLHEDRDCQALVQALLLTPAASAEEVAGALGLLPLVVEAYEALFFNVLDRTDLTYLHKVATTPRSGEVPSYAADSKIAEHRALLVAGLNGSLQDVLILAGCGRTGDTAAASPADSLIQTILGAGNAWLAGHRNPSSLPPIVAEAIQIAKRSATPSLENPDHYHQSTGVFYEIVSAQLEADTQALKAKFALNCGPPSSDPVSKAAQQPAQVTQTMARPVPWRSTVESSYSLVNLGQPRQAYVKIS